MKLFCNSCKILSFILTDRGEMRSYRFVFACSLMAGCLLFFACAGDSTTSAPNPRTITVTIKNLDQFNAVHIYIGEGDPSDENLVNPKESIVTMVFVPRIGYNVTVYVAQDKPGSLPSYSRDIRVTQTAWESRVAELHWTGASIIPVGW